jgi:hypothetical protein
MATQTTFAAMGVGWSARYSTLAVLLILRIHIIKRSCVMEWQREKSVLCKKTSPRLTRILSFSTTVSFARETISLSFDRPVMSPCKRDKMALFVDGSIAT